MSTLDLRDRTWLYRLYDASGALLYVGQSKNPHQRIRTHRNRHWTWGGQVADWRIEEFATRQLAWQAEREAIRAEHPLHNVETYPGSAKAPQEKRVQWSEVQRAICLRWYEHRTGLRESLEQLMATGLDAREAGRKLTDVQVDRRDLRRRAQNIAQILEFNPDLHAGRIAR